MHYGFLAPELHGHLNPMTTLGAELAKRGHRVTLLSSSRGKPFAERAGLSWVPLNDTPENGQGWDRLGELSGLAALKLTGRLLQESVNVTRADAPRLISTLGIDALVVDQFAPAGALVSEELGMPFVIACNAIAAHPHPSVPPPAFNWSYRTGFLGRTRNRLGNWLCRVLIGRYSGGKSGDRVSPLALANLERKWGNAMVSQQPACFDFPFHPRPAHFHYTAPWHHGGRDADLNFPWEWLDGRPMVYASMGTLQNRLRNVFLAMIEAVRGLDLQLVISLGSHSGKLDAGLPENVIVVPFAPQLKLIDLATAVITHAGLNTALETLARQKPMLCIPVTNDQPGIARRVEYLGAGEVLSLGRASSDRVRQKLTRILMEPGYRECAHRLGMQIKGLNGPKMAADIIETSTGMRN